ncbi:MAG: PAS domain S-box protein, partial [Vicinamibacterales bacterium]
MTGRRMAGDDTERPFKALRPEELGLAVLGRILDVAIDGVLVTGSQRQIVYANPAISAIIGYPHRDLLGRDFLDFVAPRAQPEMLGYVASSLAGKPGHRASVVIRPDGEEREIEYTNMLLTGPDGPLICAIVRDVTETRRRERETRSLAQIAASLTLDQSMEQTLDSLAAHVVDATRALAVAVLLMDEDGRNLRTVGTHGLPDGAGAALEAAWPAALNRSPVARAFQTQRVFIMRDARARNLSVQE